MGFLDEIVKLQRTRRTFVRFAFDENNANRLWSGPVDRRYGKTSDDTQLVPVLGIVSRMGTIQRSLANYYQSLEIPNISMELLDPAREWRLQSGGLNDQLVYRNLSFWLRVHDDLGLNIFDQRVAVAQIRKASFPPGRRVTFDCQVASGGFLGDKIPRRFITTTDFANADPEVQGLAVPIIYGIMYDEVTPFVLPDPVDPDDPLPGSSDSDDPVSMPPITGGEVMNCDDMFSDDFEGALSGYTGGGSFTLVPGAGVGGTQALRPTVANALLTRAISGPRRAFCITWSTDSDQAVIDTAASLEGFSINREDTVLTVDFGAYGEVSRVAGAITPGTRQAFMAQGAFATTNITTTLAASMADSDLTATVAAGQGIRFGIGVRAYIDNEVIKVVSRAGDVLTVLRGEGTSVAAAHSSGAAIITRDTNGYLKVYVNGIVRVNLLNDDRIATSLATGLWSTVSFGPGGDGDDLHIGSGLMYTPGSPGTDPVETAPYAGDPLNPAPTPDCASQEAGGGSPSGGAVRAIRVGGYVNSSGGGTGGGGAPPTPQIAAPVVNISVEGPGGTGQYQYVVTAMDGQVDITDFSQRNNHTGESLPSNVVTVSNGPTRDSDFTKDNYVALTWPPVPGAQSYRIYGRYMDHEPFSLLDAQSGESGGVVFYNDGEFNGRDEFDVLKTDSHPPTTAPSSGGGGGGAIAINNVYVLAGHALKSVDEVYVLKPVIIQNFSEEGDSTPLRSDPVQVLQTSGVDYTHEIIDINGNRYHILKFVAAQQSETCEYYDVTANVTGIETNGDTTGTLITHAVDVFEHFWLNWIANNYRSSVGPYAPPGGPWFTDVPYAPGLWDAASAAATKVICDARIFAGYQFCGVLDETIEARELIRELLVSGDLELYFNNSAGPSGAWSLDMFDPTQSVSGLPLYDGSDVIFVETFSVDTRPDRMLNVFPYFAGPTTQRTGKNDPSTIREGGGWLISGEERSTASIGLHGLAVSDPLYLKWTRDPVTAGNVIQHYKSYLETPPIEATFRTGLQPLQHPLASLTRVSHPDGIGDIAGWSGHVCKIMRSDIDLDRLTSTLTLVSVDHLMLIP